ncbi:hypothetical protein [Lysobacter claricitrinus]|uniref:hypothetical protein n=1 Tax=Lysobacter claricitrinus TaxID=3367728 RepID=UPI0037DB6B62
MVRNTRTLMMYGLLAAATAAVLGSRVMPAPRSDGSPLLALVPDLVGLGALETQVWKQATPGTVAPPVVADQPLEGNRHPRGPRESRDTLDRPTR